MTEHLLDAKGQSLGRLATQAAVLLRGKDKTDFVLYKSPEVIVKIINAKEIKLTGDKWGQKTYYRHSGHPGGLKAEKADHLKDRLGATELIARAVRGMLPDNKLRKPLLKRLIIEE